MRRLTEKQAKFENEARAQEPITQKNRSGNRITNIATLDNGTMVEAFKYLKYCGLAKTSLVTKRFCDLIRTHRHKLALLDVDYIGMVPKTGFYIPKNPIPKYNDWIIRNGYSKQIPFESQVAWMERTQYVPKVYRLSPHADYKDSTPALEGKSFSWKELRKYFARTELSHENWPLFQHFFRLLTDPFIYIRHIGLPAQKDALNLLAGAINSDYGLLQCHQLTVSLEDNIQNFMSWIKGHVQCFKIDIINYSGFNHDAVFLDFFMTGGKCTSEIEVNFYDPCEAIGNFVQKFMDLKGCDGNKVVGLIECNPNTTVNIDALKCDYANFVVEGNVNQTRGLSNLVFEFVNNDIGKKLRLSISFGFRTTEFTLKVANL